MQRKINSGNLVHINNFQIIGMFDTLSDHSKAFSAINTSTLHVCETGQSFVSFTIFQKNKVQLQILELRFATLHSANNHYREDIITHS